MTFILTQSELDGVIHTALASHFDAYRYMFIAMVVAVGLSLHIAFSTRQADTQTMTQFIKTYWSELCVILSILAYGLWSVYRLASLLNGGVV
jgi:ABC-type phosphate transport system permease subunit